MGLSGGLDSTFIASVLKEKIEHAYTIGYEEGGGTDECNEASETCKHLGIQHTILKIRNHNYRKL